jgi:hypothetical protein
MKIGETHSSQADLTKLSDWIPVTQSQSAVCYLRELTLPSALIFADIKLRQTVFAHPFMNNRRSISPFPPLDDMTIFVPFGKNWHDEVWVRQGRCTCRIARHPFLLIFAQKPYDPKFKNEKSRLWNGQIPKILPICYVRSEDPIGLGKKIADIWLTERTYCGDFHTVTDRKMKIVGEETVELTDPILKK